MSFNASLFYIYLFFVIDTANSQRSSSPQTGTLGVPSEQEINLGKTGGFSSSKVPSGSEIFSDVEKLNRESETHKTSAEHALKRVTIDSTIVRNSVFPRRYTRRPQESVGNVGRKTPPIIRDGIIEKQRNKSQNPSEVNTAENEIAVLPIDSTANIINIISNLALDFVEQKDNLVSNMRSVGPSDQAGRDIISFAVRGFTPVASGSITLPINLDQSKSNTRRFQGQLQPNGSQAHDGGVTANSFPTGSLSFQNDIKHNMFVDSQLVTTVVNPGNTSHSDIPWLWQSLEISDKITGGSDSGSHKSTAKSAVDSGSDKKKTPRNNTWLNGPPQHPGFKQTDGITGFNTRQPDSFDGNNDSTTSSRNKPDSRNSLFSSKRTLPTGSPSSIFTTESRTIDISSGSLSGTFGMGTFSSSNSSSTVDSLGTRSITPSLSSTTTTSQQKTITCSEEYKAIRGHTLCMNDDPRVVLSGVTTANKISILNLHNDMRATIQPPAADLVALKWDERLAIIAAKWAKQCTFGHDNERRVLEIGTHIGQNVAVGHATWEEVVRTWYSEIRLWQYGIDPDTYLGTGRWMDVAHFTQIVQNTTYLVGCGYAECRNSPYIRFFVCNYAAGQSELAYPYTAGPRCGACARNCKNGLCDCGNNVCYNKGTLDPGTCTCKCRKPYAGSTCELLDCPVEDQWMCGQDWTAEYCSIYYNVPEECPHMCGLCKGGVGGKIRQQIKPNTTFVSDYGCRYSGIRATPEECKRYGDNGSDMNMCAREGGTISCGDCDRFINVKRDYCPVMCGLCDAPCDGKRCANSGTLDVTSCTCTCRPPFAGSTCEQVDCPPTGDPLYCRLWPRHYCGVYYNVPEECPYMCDLCSMMTTRADP